MQVLNIFSDIPLDLSEESFEDIIKGSTFRLERIISMGHATPEGKWYDQDLDEWVMVVKGRAMLRFEGESTAITLGPGDHILIPAHKKHRVEETSGQEETIWLALHFRKGY